MASRRGCCDAAGPATARSRSRPRACRADIPEGYIEGFANLYLGAAELVPARRAGRAPEPFALLTPTVKDGALGMAFIEACVASSREGGAWTSVKV